ncbi:MAG: hypothetical protein ACYDCH_10280 [Gaiellaceae bacterium]
MACLRAARSAALAHGWIWAYGGRGLAVAVGLLAAGSTLALIVAEYVALARLLHWLHGPQLRSVLRWLEVSFVAADAISLVDPGRFYDDLLKPSLAALFVSHAARSRSGPPRWRRPSPPGASTRCSPAAPDALATGRAAAARR